ncbi:DUF2894 domain-containing protein [Oceanicoccus sagamiensis]|uniref:DUF2894 domain-containing protein n=1 Tax=Oceanicoccus sagamiensis TaxID=716816 RepID=A0A1X9NIU9_9GAMM|nr:DUF2894 domain-containing protein [Oceanicoccus sagamiensis]ARN75765.1 hypothetical protein BST96_17615 [Oceanicoccus sagamiensis]
MADLADIEAMEKQGASQFDPVRFQFIKSLFERSNTARPAVASILQQKAALALNDFKRDFIADGPPAPDQADPVASPLTQLLATLEQRANHSDQGLQSSELSLSDFLRQQEKEVLSSFDSKRSSKPDSSNPGELNSVRLFRESLVKLNSDKLVTQVISEGPENPGPLNPQALVIKSLATMRELSPDYLNRFVSYIDTLLWLEQASAKVRPAKARKKTKRSRKY